MLCLGDIVRIQNGRPQEWTVVQINAPVYTIVAGDDAGSLRFVHRNNLTLIRRAASAA
jgi:hypothetical protein